MAEPFKQTQVMAATMNMAGQNWMGFPRRREVAKRVYGDCDAHLIGFQEFGITTKDCLKEVKPGIKYLLGDKPPGFDIYINPIGFESDRFTPAEHGTVWISESGEPEIFMDAKGARGFSWARFQDENAGRELLFINVHPDNVGEKARQKAADMILEFADKQPADLPVIVTADSNISVDSPNRRWRKKSMRKPYDMILDGGFVDCWTASHPTQKRPMTYHGFQGQDYEIDEWGTWDTEWILTRGFKVHNCVIIRDSYGGIHPSDHYWMKAQLAYE